jgi:hypothetical protein
MKVSMALKRIPWQVRVTHQKLWKLLVSLTTWEKNYKHTFET